MTPQGSNLIALGGVLAYREPGALVVVCRPAQLCFRTLAAAVAYALLLQTFVSLFETALAFGRAADGESFAIR
jgi:hypothetical protein